MTLLESAPTGERRENLPFNPEVSWCNSELDSSGLRVSYMWVSDPSDNDTNKEEVQRHIADLDSFLADNPNWSAPQIIDGELDDDSLNKVSQYLYGDHFPALREWRKGVPGAKALSNIYRPREIRLTGNAGENTELFSGGEIDQNTSGYFMNGIDSIGIRTRAGLLRMIAADYSDGDARRWISLACGAAIPVIDALGVNKNNVQLELIDYDDEALQFAKQFAEEASLVEGEQFSLLNRNLVRGLIASDSLVGELGEESADMVDMIGIFEYFDRTHAAKMLRNAYRLVAPDGALVFANMLSSRPQLDFNLRGVGWPDIYPRSMDELAAIMTDAGISLDQAEVFVPEDGVYAVIKVRK